MIIPQISSRRSGGLYVHIPYCRSKCIYCDFFNAGARIADWNGLSRAFARELRLRFTELPSPLHTIYIGGGTPSLMPLEYLAQIPLMTRSLLGDDNYRVKEFTLEVNPEDVSDENASRWAEMGVNRISMGVQSLVDSELSAIRRNHTASRALNAIRILQKHFSNISLDIMFGIPGQTLHSLQYTLQCILNLRPQHISAYSLMYEEGTPLTVLANKNRIKVCEEKLSLEMFTLIRNELTKSGYEQYEISNYALPSYRSIHNSSYWTGDPYLGIGPSAHSYDGYRTRRANPADIKRYLSHYGGDCPPPDTAFHAEENLSDTELMEERIMLSLRTAEGLDLDRFSKDFGKGNARILRDAASRLSSVDIRSTDTGLILTPQSIMHSDRIIIDLISSLPEKL
ncbi:MAG: radical SAM family heme chaperone HemW [Muribaculum sp.]|nr:radical SAM family heme chaperone HemW [Muribaculum sp.]